MKKFILLIFGLILMGTINAQQAVLDSLRHQDYMEYAKRAQENGFDVQSESEWNRMNAIEYKTEKLFPNSPGTYLIKAKKQIIGGFTLQTVSAIGTIGAAFLNDPGRKAVTATMGGLSFIGLILEINGVVNIGKAGVSLNENGIGINVKF